jgi:DnaK suppressor protein
MARRDALLRLQKTLLARRNELRKRLGRDLDDLNVNGMASDTADAAFDAGTEEISSQLAEMESSELVQIERALQRIKQGSYGICEGCGCKIPMLRLNALPYTTLCIKCQREAENDESDSDDDRFTASWERVRDHDSNDDDKEIDFSDLEADIPK